MFPSGSFRPSAGRFSTLERDGPALQGNRRLAVVLASVMPASAEITSRVFTVDLTGEAEVTAGGVPNQGDLDGSGTETVSTNPGTGEVCWTIEVAEVDTIAAAHIHEAPSTAPGPIVVHLDPDTGCGDIAREPALDIITDPTSYYVNVHNAEFSRGALRGQLTFAR